MKRAFSDFLTLHPSNVKTPFFFLTFKTPSFMNEPTKSEGVNSKCHAAKAEFSTFLAFSAFSARSA
jgi:hypothetical protein